MSVPSKQPRRRSSDRHLLDSDTIRQFEDRLRELERWADRADPVVTAHERRLEALEPVVDKLSDAAESAAAVAGALDAAAEKRRARISRMVSLGAGGVAVLGFALRFVRV